MLQLPTNQDGSVPMKTKKMVSSLAAVKSYLHVHWLHIFHVGAEFGETTLKFEECNNVQLYNNSHSHSHIKIKKLSN